MLCIQCLQTSIKCTAHDEAGRGWIISGFVPAIQLTHSVMSINIVLKRYAEMLKQIKNATRFVLVIKHQTI